MLVQLQQAKVLPCPILSRHHLLNACNLACYNLNRSFANTKLYSRCAIVYSHLPCRFSYQQSCAWLSKTRATTVVDGHL
jgi:hypothetical protein